MKSNLVHAQICAASLHALQKIGSARYALFIYDSHFSLQGLRSL